MKRERVLDIAFWSLLAAAWLGLGYLFFGWVVPQDVIAFDVQGRNVEIVQPLFFGLLLTLPVLWIVQRFTLSDLPRYQRWINVGLRSLVVVAIAAALVQVVLTTFESRVSTIFLVDVSASVPDEVLDQAVDEVNRAIEARGEGDTVGVVAFAAQPYEVPLGDDGKLAEIPRPESDEDQLVSDPSGALRMAYGLFPQDHLKRVVLISDGNQTNGDILGEVHRATAFGIRFYNREIPFEPRPEVLVRGLDFPNEIKVGEPFNFVARIFTTHEVEVDLQVWQNDFKDGNKSLKLEKGMNEIPFETAVYEPGFKVFKLEMKVNGADHFEANNSYVHSMNVRGKPRILYVEGEMRSRYYLERALKQENFDIETRGPRGIPTSIEELAGFDLVLVSDVAAMFMSEAQMRLLDQYTRELGGGLIVVGGENSFGPGGYYDTYLERVLPVDFDSEKRRNTPSLALMLVVDKSGSMKGERIELAKDAAKATVEILQKDDKVGVAAFDDGVQPLVRMQSASNRVRIASDISRLRASGGTNIASALAYAFEELAITQARLKHIILLTDGNSESGNIFSEVIPALRIENITVSTVAVGNESDTTLLRRIAEGGNGRYYYTNDPYNVPRIFTKETSTVSRSSMVEEPFRPTITKRAQVLKGIPWESAPYLLGYVSTRAKPEAELLMVSDYDEPILARWRNGLGKVVAFTSDLKNRWAVEWVRWPGYSKFWAQLIRDTMRADDTDTLAMTTTIEQDAARIVVDAIGDDDRFINDLTSTVAITAPGGDTTNVVLEQTAAGRYEATVPLDKYGSYALKANHDKGGDTLAVSLGTISYPYPREVMFTDANTALLQRAADVGNGETNPSVETLFDPMGEEVKYRRELWPYFVLLALALLVLDLGLRRIRLSGETDISWDKVV